MAALSAMCAGFVLYPQHPVTHTQLGRAILVLELACCGEHDEQCYDHEDGRNSQWRRIVRTKHEKTGKSGNSRGSTHLVAGVDDAGSSSRLAGAALPDPHGGDWAKGCTLPKSSEDHAK